MTHPSTASLSHVLRFARTLALVGTAVTAGCGVVTTNSDAAADSALPDTAVSDVPAADVALTCSDCDCQGSIAPPDPPPHDSGRPYCESIGLNNCCAAVGPLPPPELPVRA